MFEYLQNIRNKNERFFGLVLMNVSGFLFAVSNALIQYVYFRNLELTVSSFQVLFIRSIVQVILSIPFMIHGKTHPYNKDKKFILPLIEMSIAEVCAIIFLYFALERIAVGDVTVLNFTAPVFTVLFSFIFLRKGCGFVESIFGTMSFLGVLFIAKPDLFGFYHEDVIMHMHNVNAQNKTNYMQNSSSNLVIGTGFALLGVISLSLFLILNKLNGMSVDIILTVFYPSVLGIIVSPIGMAIQKSRFLTSEIGVADWVILSGVGVLYFFGLFFMGKSLQLEDAGPAILIRNLDVIYAYIMQYLLLHQAPSIGTLIGTIIVLSCTSAIVINRIFQLEDKYCRKVCLKLRQKDHDTEEETDFLSKQFDDDNEDDDDL